MFVVSSSRELNHEFTQYLSIAQRNRNLTRKTYLPPLLFHPASLAQVFFQLADFVAQLSAEYMSFLCLHKNRQHVPQAVKVRLRSTFQIQLDVASSVVHPVLYTIPCLISGPKQETLKELFHRF